MVQKIVYVAAAISLAAITVSAPVHDLIIETENARIETARLRRENYELQADLVDIAKTNYDLARISSELDRSLGKLIFADEEVNTLDAIVAGETASTSTIRTATKNILSLYQTNTVRRAYRIQTLGSRGDELALYEEFDQSGELHLRALIDLYGSAKIRDKMERLKIVSGNGTMFVAANSHVYFGFSRQPMKEIIDLSGTAIIHPTPPRTNPRTPLERNLPDRA